MVMSLRALPWNVWHSSEFDCKKAFDELFPNYEISEEDVEIVQNDIQERLEDNAQYFNDILARINSLSKISNSVTDIQLLLEIETEKMNRSIEKSTSFSAELKRIAGPVIELAAEKRKLTTDITKKKQLQMIRSGLDQINSYRDQKNFKEVSNLIIAAEQLLANFSDSRNTADPEIAQIADKLVHYKVMVGRDIVEVFQQSIDGSGQFVKCEPTDLFGCCLVADNLENNYRALLIKIFLEKMFCAYRSLFPANISVMSLKTLDQRFKWAHRMLKSYEGSYRFAFPGDWQMEILLAQAIANWIKEDIVSILSAVPMDRRVSEDIFIQALSQASSFDLNISLRFQNSFSSSVTQAFQDYHYFLFEAKEDEFNALKSKLLPKDCVKNINTVMKRDQKVLSNIDQIFLFFTEVLNTFSQLSSGVLLIQFSYFLSDSMETVSAYLESQFNIISVKSSKKWSSELGKLTCCLISTVDYCISNVRDQTEKTLSHIKAEDLRGQVCLESLIQKFLVCRSIGMTTLLNRYENDISSLIQQYTKSDWNQSIRTVDPSPFVIKVAGALDGQSKFGVDQMALYLPPQTCRLFFEKLVSWFMEKMSLALFKFKYINEIGAEQMLIDLFGLRAFFIQRIPPANWKAKDLATWAQTVSGAMEKYEIYLKVLLTPIQSPEPFVQSYLLLLADFKLENFLKMLELKGVDRKNGQQAFVDEFARHAPPTPSELQPVARSSSINRGTWSNGIITRLKGLSVSVIKSYSRKKQPEIEGEPITSPSNGQGHDGLKF